MSEKPSKRYHLIDQIRGFAVVLMIIFHFAYDLTLFGYLDLTFSKGGGFWYYLPRVIVFLFLIPMGMSLTLVHRQKIKWRLFMPRFLLLAFWALVISLVTYFLFPSRWIYFGTLHCIALCSLGALPFLDKPKLCLTIGFMLLAPAVIWGISLPWFSLGHYSMDYIPFFPWIGVVLWGIFATHRGWHKLEMPFLNKLKFLGLLGKHSLKIYLLHQPILFGLVKTFHHFSN